MFLLSSVLPRASNARSHFFDLLVCQGTGRLQCSWDRHQRCPLGNNTLRSQQWEKSPREAKVPGNDNDAVLDMNAVIAVVVVMMCMIPARGMVLYVCSYVHKNHLQSCHVYRPAESFSWRTLWRFSLLLGARNNWLHLHTYQQNYLTRYPSIQVSVYLSS